MTDLPLNDSTVRDLQSQIERLEVAIAKEDKIVNAAWTTIGAYEAGRSNYTMGKRHQQSVNRRADAFKRQQEARANLATLQNRLRLYQAGEVYANGQTRADSPSRKKKAAVEITWAEFMRSLLKKGDRVALAFNPNNLITIKRVSAKSVTSEMDVNRKYSELIPVSPVTGVAMTGKEMGDAYRAWETAQQTS